MKPYPAMSHSEPMNENERRRLECIAAARADVPHAIAGDSRTPRFMELIRGIYASERNPQRDGMFVEVIRRTGRMNHGTFYRITDGKGSFWTYPASSTLIIGQLDCGLVSLSDSKLINLYNEVGNIQNALGRWRPDRTDSTTIGGFIIPRMRAAIAAALAP